MGGRYPRRVVDAHLTGGHEDVDAAVLDYARRHGVSTTWATAVLAEQVRRTMLRTRPLARGQQP